MHPWYGMRTSMHQWYVMGGGMHLWYGMRGSMHHSHLLLQLRGHIPVCIRTGACACNKVHFYNCICGNAAHFDLSNISSTADRQTDRRRTKFWSNSCLETSSRVDYSNITLNSPPSSVWRNFKTIRGQNIFKNWSLVHSVVLSLCSPVQFCPVISDQKVHWKQKEQQPVFVSTFVNLESSS